MVTSPPKPATWTYAETYVPEDEVIAAARGRAEEVGVAPIGSGGGAALRFLASVLDARAVVEIGTGTGVSGVWLLRGMRGDGVLTTVDIEAEHQRLARETYNEAGVAQQRVRTIAGAALDVLPRLTDGHYDLVFADGDKVEYGAYLNRRIAVDPDRAAGQDRGEVVAVPLGGGSEDLGHRGARHEVPGGAGGGAGSCEEPEDGHGGWRSLPVGGRRDPSGRSRDAHPVRWPTP